jgi:hypothetical protein
MGKKRKYVSPLLLQLVVDDDPIIVIGGSMDTGGVGECFEETAMFSGKYGAEVYFLGEDGVKTLVGYHQVIEEAPDYDSYYDLEGNEIDMAEYMFDFEMYVGETFGLWCDYGGMGGL